jgi:hypothetical protein
MVTAYILVQTEVGKAAQVAKDIIDITGVQQAQAITGPLRRDRPRRSSEHRRARPAGGRTRAGSRRHHPHAHLSSGAPLVRLGHLRLDRAAATTTRAETVVCGERLHWRHPGHRRL